MANLIPIGTATTAWTDVAVTDAPKALFIIDAGSGIPLASGPTYELAIKTSGGLYNVLVQLDSQNILKFGGLTYPATYGVRRVSSGYSSGMDVSG